jgi:RNA polymerase sigma-70 factor (ECF subfamily)
MPAAQSPSTQDLRYRQAAEAYARDIARFVAGYERDPARRHDLLQDVHLALWRSMAAFEGQCSLRTWVYRVAHNVGVSHVQRSVSAREGEHVSLDEAAARADDQADITLLDRRLDLDKVLALVHALAPLDREVMLLYLEDLDAATIGEITGLSARNIATKIHRLKAALARRLETGGSSP